MGKLRLLIGCWLVAAFVATAAYSGNLRAFRVKQELTPTVDSIQVQSNKIKTANIPCTVKIIYLF